jgi:KaiC/GvpD/RAD55 family RecA-like ATPase
LHCGLKPLNIKNGSILRNKQEQMSHNRLSVGISGLNEVIGGGLIPQRSYLVRGGPGTGKTTLGFHFLTAGVEVGEKPLFITLGEPEAQLRAVPRFKPFLGIFYRSSNLRYFFAL